MNYTKTGLAAVFVWLLWGDFCFSLMESVVPSLLPLLLKDHGASNKEIAIIVGTIASVFNMVITPTVSFRSDRHRGRFGRRIPFLIWPTPFIVLFLALLPFAPELTQWLLRHAAGQFLFALSPSSAVITMIGILVVLFQLFNMVVSSVYFYLFNDVVPERYLGRFFALFRVFGTLAGFCFQYFILGLSATHMEEIFIGLALLYGFAFALMCWRVKEGEYPPVANEQRNFWWDDVRNYVTQCFSKGHYIWFYVAYTLYNWALASQVFWIFFLRDDLKMDLDTIGKYRSWSLLLVLPLAYPFGLLVDKFRSQRMIMLATALQALANLGCCLFIHGKWSFMILMFVWTAPYFLYIVANAVWFPDLLPRARYGQFASAASLINAVTLIFIAPLCGWLFDHLHAYRYSFLWTAVLQTCSFLALLKVYQGWKRHGGPENYVAP